MKDIQPTIENTKISQENNYQQDRYINLNKEFKTDNKSGDTLLAKLNSSINLTRQKCVSSSPLKQPQRHNKDPRQHMR